MAAPAVDKTRSVTETERAKAIKRGEICFVQPPLAAPAS
jgi:hypothetical protein